MSFAVYITDSAARDLADIDEYIATHDSPKRADYILGRIEAALNKLADLPERGSYPRELSTLGIREYREVYFKPYRIIYRIISDRQIDIITIHHSRRLLGNNPALD